jgi:hypothetical protein
MMNRHTMVDPEEQARRRALSDVLAPSTPDMQRAEAGTMAPPRMSTSRAEPRVDTLDGPQAPARGTRPSPRGSTMGDAFGGAIPGGNESKRGATAGPYEAPEPEAPEPTASTDLQSRSGSMGDLRNRGPINRSGVELGGDGLYTKEPKPGIESASEPTPPADAAPQPMGDPSAWNTDGFPPPAITPPIVPIPAGMSVDPEKWNDPNHQTPKYVWLRIAAANPGNPQAQVEQLLKAYPGATFNGKDKVEGIPGLGPIDIFQGASSGQNTPQWYDINAAAAEGGGGGGTTPFDTGGYVGPQPRAAAGLPDGQSPINGLNDSTYQALLRRLQELTGTPQSDQAALGQVLGGK